VSETDAAQHEGLGAWVHPRFKYRNAIEDAAWAAAGEPPERGDWLAETNSRPVRKNVGKSRTRIVAYEHCEPKFSEQLLSMPLAGNLAG